jgi:uncharacterized OB-fold protein
MFPACTATLIAWEDPARVRRGAKVDPSLNELNEESLSETRIY